MSAKHLATGSVEPPRVDGLLRVYSMEYCPFAQRARLVIKAKGVPHDIVNIDLTKKPEWYLKIHPDGKVPALLDGDKIIVESLDICDYLDKKYPENPLYPTDQEAKKNDKEVISLIGPALSKFYKFQHGSEKNTPEEVLNLLLPPVEPLEKELTSRGTTFFGGDKPGMIDYVLWPWAERTAVIPLKLGVKKLPLKDNQIPNLRKWSKAMQQVPVVAELINPPEKFWKLQQAREQKLDISYDTI